MKIKRGYLPYFSIIFLCPFFLNFSQDLPTIHSQNNYLSEKELKSHLSKMIYVAGDTFTVGNTSVDHYGNLDSDSTLFAGNVPKRAIVDPFYISATEVTNGEWKIFYQDKVRELGEKISKRKFYPNTSLSPNFVNYNSTLFTQNYFSQPKFNNYPVVGITWEQANAYCNWKSKKLQVLLEKSGAKSSVTFRLPTEAEWELAALDLAPIKIKGKERYRERQIYIWPEENMLGNLDNLTNIGQILDINKIVLKQYADDGCLYTCEVGTYAPNKKGLYNMGGNVSEWTSDPGFTKVWDIENETFKTLYGPKEIDHELEIITTKYDVDEPYSMAPNILSTLRHNKKVLKSNDIKICKGGSWANGLIYTQIGSRQGFSKKRASTKIGFRIATSNLDPAVAKYLPKKNWKPEK